MKKMLLTLTVGLTALSSYAYDDIDELIVEEDPYIGVKISLENFQDMVALSNVTKELTPSKMVENIDNLITPLAQTKTAEPKMFKDSVKKIKYLPKTTVFTVDKVLKTAVYRNNVPDEYTTYLLKDENGKVYALPDFELNDVSRAKLTPYEQGLMDSFKDLNNKARIVIYFKKPALFKDKHAPYDQKDLNSVFDFFLDRIKNYEFEKVLLSERNFRLSMTVPIDTLAYLISEFDRLYIEDIEVISYSEKENQENQYAKAKIRYNQPKSNSWYDK